MSSSRRSRLSCWMVVTRFSTFCGVDLRFLFGRSYRGPGLVNELHGGRIYPEALEVSARHAESQRSIRDDFSNNEDYFRPLRDDFVPDLRRSGSSEEFARRLAWLGCGHIWEVLHYDSLLRAWSFCF